MTTDRAPNRFLVLGMPRTGSTLLLTGLSQHPQIRAYGELFHQVRSEREGSHALIRDGLPICFDENQDDAIQFLDSEVFCPVPSEIRAVGFKLFGEHVKCSGTERLFSRLKEAYPDVKIIHIRRPNYLDVLISREMAKATRNWIKLVDAADAEKSFEPAPRPQRKAFHIDPSTASAFFENMRLVDDFFREFFQGPNYHEVLYQNLAADYEGQLNAVYRHLGVDAHRPRQMTAKQIESPASGLISNMGELRTYFRGTRFAPMLEGERGGIDFVSESELRIGPYRFEMDETAAVQSKYSAGQNFVLMKRRRLIETYREVFESLAPSNLLELGIRRGGSMALYNLAFKPRIHVGIELEQQPIPALAALVAEVEKQGRRLAPYFGVSQDNRPKLIEIVGDEFGDGSKRPLDMVIDDASHRLEPSTVSFETLFPLVRTGGLYALEDWGWAHWKGFQEKSAYFADQPALSNLVFQLLILHTCRPDIISELSVTPVVVFVRRGPTLLSPELFRIAPHLVMRGKQLIPI